MHSFTGRLRKAGIILIPDGILEKFLALDKTIRKLDSSIQEAKLYENLGRLSRIDKLRLAELRDNFQKSLNERKAFEKSIFGS